MLTQDEKDSILVLATKGHTNSEIAEMLGKKKTQVASFIQRSGGNPSYRKRIKKYDDDKIKKAFEIFQKASFDETAEIMGLTKTELKSLMTIGYTKERFCVYRKDTRINHRRKWTVTETTKMLKWAGLIPRKRIALKLNRGNDRVIKERLMKIGIATRNINGIPVRQFAQFFGKEANDLLSSGKIVPSGIGRFNIILWVDVSKLIKGGLLAVTPTQELIVETRAKFQNWLWGGSTKKKILLFLTKEKKLL